MIKFMQVQYSSIFKKPIEVLVLTLALFYKLITNFFFWLAIFVAVDVYLYKHAEGIKNELYKLGRVNIKKIDKLPDLELKESLFNKSREDKMTEINNFLSKIPTFSKINISHSVIKKLSGKNLSQATINVTASASFSDLVKTIKLLKSVGYKINDVEISNPEGLGDKQIMKLNFSALYYENTTN